MATALVAAGSIDLLHAHLPRAHLLSGLVGKLTNRPVLATIHGRQVTTLDLEVHRATGSHLSVVCRQSCHQALGLGVSAGLPSCDSNGVDSRNFKPRPGRPARLREQLDRGAGADGDDEAPLIGFVGRLSPEKGPEVAVRAAMLLQARCPQAHLVMVGEGPMHAELEAQIAILGLAGKVHLLGPRNDMPDVYNDLDLLVCSSYSEALPLALMEAMASGLPTVATRVGGVPDIVEHGQTVWLVGPGDFDDIANRCAQLLTDDELRQHMGRRARVRACERFSPDEGVNRLSNLMRRLARPRGEVARRMVSGLPSNMSGIVGGAMRRSASPRNGAAS